MRRFLILLFFCFAVSDLECKEHWGVVIVPVADIRSKPESLPTAYDYDPEQETQVLYGEVVKIVSEKSDWLRVEADEQKEFSHRNIWQGYPGWIKKECVRPVKKIPSYNAVVQEKSAQVFLDPRGMEEMMLLSLGTKIKALKKVNQGYRKITLPDGKTAWIQQTSVRFMKPLLSNRQARSKIVESAKKLLGDPYFWGGRSAHIPQLKNQITASDCSGFVNLAYRTAGIDIPRDSYEQFIKAKRIKKADLKAGDLVFSASKEKPDQVTHVVIFLDEQSLIEAPKTGGAVREISFEEKFGLPLQQIRENELNMDRVIYFGSYFED